jgi:hypothetical protein
VPFLVEPRTTNQIQDQPAGFVPSPTPFDSQKINAMIIGTLDIRSIATDAETRKQKVDRKQKQRAGIMPCVPFHGA